MEFTKRDLGHITNLTSILNKTTVALTGAEVLAAAEAYRWISKLQFDTEVALGLRPPPEPVVRDGEPAKLPEPSLPVLAPEPAAVTPKKKK